MRQPPAGAEDEKSSAVRGDKWIINDYVVQRYGELISERKRGEMCKKG
jgi:hypothetical protein